MALDLSKAFDTIDHSILISKLSNFKLGRNTTNFFSDYLRDRTYTVRTNNSCSDVCNVAVGVPQGSILGPLLFTMYVNDLPEVVNYTEVIMYADDTTIITSSKFPSNIQVNLAADLCSLESWFERSKLKLNADKTDFLIIANGHRREKFRHVKVDIGGRRLEEKETTKILGVTINNSLTWDSHLKKMLNNLKYYYRGFSRSCRMLSQDSRKLLYNAAIASRLSYCDMVWDNCTLDDAKKLQTIQNRCARRILNQLPGTSAGPLMRKLGWLNLSDKRKLHKCVLMHKLLTGDGPDALIELMQPLQNRTTVPTRATSRNCFFIPRFNTDYVKISFAIDTAKLWNSLPYELKSEKNTKTFKEKLHIYFLTQ